MKKLIIPYMTAVAILSLAACENVDTATKKASDAVTDPVGTTNTVVHKTDPFATDTTTTTTQKSLQQPVKPASSSDIPDSN